MLENFNSHARVGRDFARLYLSLTSHDFNSHARVGRDGVIVPPQGAHHGDFNSHARVGRDCPICVSGMAAAPISTHTPV